jgi:hypothetical protein
VPVLIDDAKSAAGNAWGISLMSMFHMTNDSVLFATYAELQALGGSLDNMSWTLPDGTTYLPLYEPKMFDAYNHRAASYASRGAERGYRVLPDTTEEERANPWFRVQPYYWVREHSVYERLGNRRGAKWVFGFKEITSPTNERTFVCAIAPVGGFGNKMPLIFVSETIAPPLQCALIANLSSLPFDYVTRQKVGGVTLNYFLVKQFPVLTPTAYAASDLEFIVPRVLELIYNAGDMQSFAEDIGCHSPPFAWNPDRRAILRAELDAWYARAYGLTRDQLRYILDPADVKGADYPSETFRVLKNNEISRFGEYRTARLVLQAWDAWDRLERGELAA